MRPRVGVAPAVLCSGSIFRFSFSKRLSCWRSVCAGFRGDFFRGVSGSTQQRRECTVTAAVSGLQGAGYAYTPECVL